jgi:DNA-damage-inducible protein J
MPTEAIIETHVDAALKQQAEAIFAEAGTTIDQFFRELLVKTVNYNAVPQGFFGYNAETLEAIESARSGDFEGEGSINDLFNQLRAEK